ncbi:YcaO-like family protein [Labrys okinawensis]|uniref:YcaO-like family protein n=1 Tax=Labrys okinawensis TaxID=346911 RepID=UPI0039BCAD09
MDGASSHSSREVSENNKFSSFSPPLAPFGITRAGDLTDLDVIGIPVWFAVRPNSRTLSLSQGKGLTHEQARISAIMESVEGAVAEQTSQLVAEFGTPAEMTSRGKKLVPLDRLDRCDYAAFDPTCQRAWVRGQCYGTGEPIFAPYELIGLDMRVEFPWDYDVFSVGSSGLAAGPNFYFAALAALLELVERDATFAVEQDGFQPNNSRLIRWQRGCHAGLDEAVDKVRLAGLEPSFFEIPNRFGLPVVAAVIARPILHVQGAGERLSGGYACRMTIGEATLAALLEAAQSRLTNIAGSRDDLAETEYEEAGATLPSSASEAIPLAVCTAQCTSESGMSVAEKLDFVAECLGSAGCADVYFFDLPGPVKGVHVVRALVPRLRVFGH